LELKLTPYFLYEVTCYLRLIFSIFLGDTLEFYSFTLLWKSKSSNVFSCKNIWCSIS